MPTVEQFQTYRDGKMVTLWRCVDCFKSLSRATGKPVQDNGFVEWPNPIKHLPGCELSVLPPRRKSAQNQGELF